MEWIKNKKMIPLPNKKYKIIYADPPYEYRQGKSMGTRFQGACDRHYKTIPIRELCNLPIKEITDTDCILFLWVTFPQLKEGLQLIKAWGFEYKTIAFNWIKQNNNGTAFFGIGYYTKSNGEICLLATKGNPHKFVINNSISQMIFTKRMRHSQKPSEVRAKIISLLGDLPRIELFARHKIEGWDAWGLEVPKEEQKLLKNEKQS